MFRFFTPVAVAVAVAVSLTLALPAQAGGKFGSPPPSAHLAPMMAQVLGRAQKSVGKEISKGVRLTVATSQGNTVVFMTRADSVAAAEVGLIRDPSLSLQQRFVKTFGQKFCRKGSGSQKFVAAGGSISIALQSRSGKLMAGGNLTRCN